MAVLSQFHDFLSTKHLCKRATDQSIGAIKASCSSARDADGLVELLMCGVWWSSAETCVQSKLKSVSVWWNTLNMFWTNVTYVVFASEAERWALIRSDWESCGTSCIPPSDLFPHNSYIRSQTFEYLTGVISVSAAETYMLCARKGLYLILTYF